MLLLIFWGNGTGILPQMDEWSKANPRALHDFRYSTKKWSHCSFAHWIAVTLIWIEWCHVKQLYRRTFPPGIGAERWADNTSTISKRRMSFSLSSLQISYTVSFGTRRGNNRVMPRFHTQISRELKQIRRCINRKVVVSVFNFQLSSASQERLCLGSKINSEISRGSREWNSIAQKRGITPGGKR